MYNTIVQGLCAGVSHQISVRGIMLRTHAHVFQALCDSNGTLMYSLYGVVVHSGGLLNGHYVAYTRTRDAKAMATPTTQATARQEEVQQNSATLPPIPNSPSLDQSCPQRWFDYSSTKGQWYYASDSHVRIATEAEAMKSQAYLLFYERLPFETKSKWPFICTRAGPSSCFILLCVFWVCDWQLQVGWHHLICTYMYTLICATCKHLYLAQWWCALAYTNGNVASGGYIQIEHTMTSLSI